MAEYDALTIGMAMSDVIRQSRCNQITLRSANGENASGPARFEHYVHCTLVELETTFRSSPRVTLIQDIQEIRQVLRMIANYSGARDDGFLASVRSIVTLIQQLLDIARQHPAVGPRLDSADLLSQSQPRSDAATASKTSSSLLREAGIAVGWSRDEAVAASGEWTSPMSGVYPQTIDELSDVSSSDDSEDSGCRSHSTTNTSISEGSLTLKG